MKKKTILVLLSSGLDSTYVAYKALSEGHKVIPIYIELMNTNIPKSMIEYQQSQNIYSILKQEFGNNILTLKKIKIYRTSGNQFENWIHAINNKKILNVIDEVHFGATKSDIDDSFTLEDAESRLDYAQTQLNKEVKFPILNLTKKDISKILPKSYQSEVYTCEIPLYSRGNENIIVEQCGICNSCHLNKINSIKLSGPFILGFDLTDEEIEEGNTEHEENKHYSNYYGQQNEKYVLKTQYL